MAPPFVEVIVGVIGGFLIGEMADVWYDGKVYYDKLGRISEDAAARAVDGAVPSVVR